MLLEMFLEFLRQHFELIQTISIVLGLIFTAKSFRRATKSDDENNRARQMESLLRLTENYNKLKTTLIDKPEFAVIFESRRKSTKITPIQEHYIKQKIMHMFIVYKAVELGQLENFEGLRKDMQQFLSLPLPAIVWKKNKDFHTSL